MTADEALESLRVVVRTLRRRPVEEDERRIALGHAQALLADVEKYAGAAPAPTQIVDPALTGSPPPLPPENSHEAGVAGGPPPEPYAGDSVVESPLIEDPIKEEE